MSEPALAAAPESNSPFKFLDFFEEADRDLFAGRDREVNEVLAGILRARTLVLYGRSGLGKTSLLLAGVLPEIRKRGLTPVYMRPFDRPLDDLRTALEESFPDLDITAESTVEDILRTASAKQGIVLVLDQLEELFIRFRERSEIRWDFVETIAGFANDPSLEVRIIFSLREDYLAELDDFRTRLSEPFINEYRLHPLTAFGARQAISQALQHAGLSYEQRLLTGLVDALEEYRYDPAILQILCSEFYRQTALHPRAPETLKATDLEQLGGLEGIIRSYLENLDNDLQPHQRFLAMVVLDRLVSRARTKSAVTIESLATAPKSTSPFKVLDFFEEADHNLFAGRDREVNEVLAGILRSRALVLYGRSRLGKTSLLLAGVFPEIRKRGLTPVYMRPSDRPLDDLRTTLKETFPNLDISEESTLADILRTASTRKGIVLVLDQVEELFIRFRERSEMRWDFIEAIAGFAKDPSLEVRIILSLREDYLAKLDDFRPLLPELFVNKYRLPPLTAFGARQAISRALQHAGLSYEQCLLTGLVDALEEYRYDPAILQILCSELYRKTALHPGTSETLKATGLGQLGGLEPQLELLLRSAVYTKTSDVPYWAERTGLEKSIEILLEMLDSPNQEIKDSAADAARYLSDPSGQLAKRCLELALEEDKEKRATGHSLPVLRRTESDENSLKGYSLGDIQVDPDPKPVESYTFATVGSSAKLADLRAQAWIEYADALRVSGRTHEAEEAFAKAQRFCKAGTGDPPLRANLLGGLVSLRYFQRRFDEAIALADEAGGIYSELGESHSVASTKVQVQKAMAQIYAGEPAAAVRTLNQVIPLIENESDPHLLFAARHNLIRAHIDSGEPEQALSLYFEARDLYQDFHDPLMALRAGWQEGQLLRDLGHLRAAEAALLLALQGFQERELFYEVALVSLDLSEVYLRLGDIEKLREAVGEMAPIFASLRVDREMLAALLQLQKADQQSRQVLELIRMLRSRVELLHPKMVK